MEKNPIGQLRMALVAIFMLFLLLPLAEWKLGMFKHLGVEEKGVKPTPPALSQMSVDTLPKLVTSYFHKTYGYRGLFIMTGNTIRYEIYGQSPTQKIILGKGDWLFYASPTDGDILNDYRHANRYSPEQLAAIAQKLTSRRDALRALGSQYVILLVPNKGSIYPEYLPQEFQDPQDQSRYDQLVQYLKQNTDLRVVDTKPRLLREKATRNLLLYSMRDAHWNSVGAFIGYEALMEELVKIFPQLKPRRWEDFTIEEGPQRPDLEVMLGVFTSRKLTGPMMMPRYDMPRVEFPDFTHILYNAPSAKPEQVPSAIIFRDSFFTALGPYMPEHFTKVLFYWTVQFSMKEVVNAPPSLVVEEHVERYLNHLAK